MSKPTTYANSQIIAHHDGDHTTDRYFYLHDRLGSVREVIDTNGDVDKAYTYSPFGSLVEGSSPGPSRFLFTGQWYDHEIGQYYLRARMYDPYIGRFTSRDPIFGSFEEPLTLHTYLYCLNNPVNRTDPSGEFSYVDVAFSASMNSALYGLSAYFKGARGTALLMPMFKGALLGGGASFLSFGLQAEFLTNIVKGLQSQAARGMLTGGVRVIAGELIDKATDPDYKFNLAKSFANLGVAMIMGGAKGEFTNKYFSDGTFRDGFIIGSKNAEEALQVIYRMSRMGMTELTDDLYN